jgi:predicted nucleic acid-binding Zn ribbon protein
MICKKCGERIPKGSKFCPECGYKIRKKKKNTQYRKSVIIRIIGWFIVIAVIIIAYFAITYNNSDSQLTKNVVQPRKTKNVQSFPTATATPNLAKAIIGKWEATEIVENDKTVKIADEAFAFYFTFRSDQTFDLYSLNYESKNRSVSSGYYSLSGNKIIIRDENETMYLTLINDKLSMSYQGLNYGELEGKDFIFERTLSIPTEYKTISAYQLNKEYQENEIAADNKYLNEFVEVSGKIASVNKGLISNYFYVNLVADDGIGIFTVDCKFEESDSNTLAKLKAEQQITIRGVCRGKKLMGVSVDTCYVYK